MGDPKKTKKQYNTPMHPWQAERLEEERELIKEYGLKNKREVWKMRTKLKNLSDQVKAFVTQTDGSADGGEKLLLNVMEMGILGDGAKLDDVLDLGIKSILDRRLQTIVFTKGIAKSIKQARQMVVHEHIKVGGKKITAPSYLVNKTEEGKISFDPKSTFNDETHPERIVMAEKKKKSSSKGRAPGKRKAPRKADVKEKEKKEKKTEEKKKGAKQEKKTEEKKEDK